MIEAICAHIHNYFTDEADIQTGTWTIENGTIDLSGVVIDGQYFRIKGSTLNDGVYQYPVTTPEGAEPILKDETFTGEIWPMKVPRAVVQLAADIAAWQAQYGAAMASPYTSENVIGVYSYSKGANSANATGGSADAWKGVFRGRLNEWRKLA